MPGMKKPKIKGKIKKLPTDTDIIMPGRKYPKRFMDQMEAQKKHKPTKGNLSKKKPAPPNISKKLKDPRLSGLGAAKRMKEKLGNR